MYSFIRSVRGMGLCALVALGPVSIARADSAGFGVLGDSYADEYQFHPPDRSTGRNFAELLAADRDVNFGTVADAGQCDPRNQCYFDGWASTAVGPGDLPAQAAGVADQMVAGQVKPSVMLIGGNDVIDVPDGLHIGTIGQGLLANAFAPAADKNFNAGITPLSEAETIESARTVPAAVPQPRTWKMGVVGLLFVAGAGAKISRRTPC